MLYRICITDGGSAFSKNEVRKRLVKRLSSMWSNLLLKHILENLNSNY